MFKKNKVIKLAINSRIDQIVGSLNKDNIAPNELDNIRNVKSLNHKSKLKKDVYNEILTYLESFNADLADKNNFISDARVVNFYENLINLFNLREKIDFKEDSIALLQAHLDEAQSKARVVQSKIKTLVRDRERALERNSEIEFNQIEANLQIERMAEQSINNAIKDFQMKLVHKNADIITTGTKERLKGLTDIHVDYENISATHAAQEDYQEQQQDNQEIIDEVYGAKDTISDFETKRAEYLLRKNLSEENSNEEDIDLNWDKE